MKQLAIEKLPINAQANKTFSSMSNCDCRLTHIRTTFRNL